MNIIRIALAVFALCNFLVSQEAPGNFRLALSDHKGQLTWKADGFKTVESSAKPGGREIGFRGQDSSGQVNFLGFLFLVPEDAPLTSTKCRDLTMREERKDNSKLKLSLTSETTRPDDLPVATVAYTGRLPDGSLQYVARGFVATGDLCGDLEFYSNDPVSTGDQPINKMLMSLHLDPSYAPRFQDLFSYAQILYRDQNYQAAAPIFEKALGMVPADGAPFPSASIARRVATDQAGMSYGISGDFRKARALFEEAITRDPDYPMFYYNLACADAGENKLSAARAHLEQAFAHKSNVLPGETMPDPTKDDSFLPYKQDKKFWDFLEGLNAGK